MQSSAGVRTPRRRGAGPAVGLFGRYGYRPPPSWRYMAGAWSSI